MSSIPDFTDVGRVCVIPSISNTDVLKSHMLGMRGILDTEPGQIHYMTRNELHYKLRNPLFVFYNVVGVVMVYEYECRHTIHPMDVVVGMNDAGE